LEGEAIVVESVAVSGAIENILVCCYSFGTKTIVIDFGFRGTRVVTAQQHSWIFYAILEKLVVYFYDRG
jgi:hypothetical protein